jgi:alkylated DNA repair dioxygenase AlkB
MRSVLRALGTWRGHRTNVRKGSSGARVSGKAFVISSAGVGLAAHHLTSQRNAAVHFEEAPPYVPPPLFGKPFSVVKARGFNEAEKLVFGVKSLQPGIVRDVLQAWPRGAELIDAEGNTLFHLFASQSSKCDAKQTAASEVMEILLEHGWAVVDQKNKEGLRAESIAESCRAGGIASDLFKTRSRSFLEKTRVDDTLPLVREISPVPWAWVYPVEDERRRCWAGVLKSAFPKDMCDKFMRDVLQKSPWLAIPGVPRKTAFFVSEDCADCNYRYSGLSYSPTVFPPFMHEIRNEVCKMCGIPPEKGPNCCNVNVYEDHSQVVGWHSDDEVLFQGLAGDTRILSFSLGVPRDFCYRLQGTDETLGTVSLGDGDIMTMEGLFQKHYKHSVPASDIRCGIRVNFTFRWIVAKADAFDAGIKAVV